MTKKRHTKMLMVLVMAIACLFSMCIRADASLRVNWINSDYVADEEHLQHQTGVYVEWYRNVTAEGNTWFNEAEAGVELADVTAIHFSTEEPSSFESSWNADVFGSGAIKCYLTGDENSKEVTIVGDGENGLYAHKDSASLFFNGFTKATTITGLDLLHLDNVDDETVALPGINVDNHTFLGWAETPLDWLPERTAEEAVIQAETAETNVYSGEQENLYAVMKLLNKCEITTNPTDANITYGSTTTLTIVAEGTNGSDLSYQWQEYNTDETSWTDISNATSASYTTPNNKNVGTYQYRCVATSKLNSSTVTATSDEATVTIAAADYDMRGVAFSDASKVYNGETQGLTVSGTLPTGADDKQVTVSYSAGRKDIGSTEITATFATTSTNYNVPEAMKATLTITAFDLSGAMIADVSAFTYNGGEHKPTPAVTAIGGTLVSGTDFTYSYSNNTNAGIDTATVTITGKGNFTGTNSKTFTINKTDYDMRGVAFSDASKVYNGETQGLTVSGTLPTGADDKQVTVSYSAGRKDIGSTEITATFATTSTNYNVPEAMKATLTITAFDLSGAMIADVSAFTYNGGEHKPTPAVTAIGGTLVSGTDFTYSYSNNTNAGIDTATVTITGKGNFTGTNSKTFTIKQKDVTISGIEAENKTYDGTTDVTLNFNHVIFGGIIDGDKLEVSATGEFESKDAANAKRVYIHDDMALSGASAGNYQLAATGQQEYTTANIAKKDITISGITAKSRTYNGVDDAELEYGSVIYGGIVPGDSLSIAATGKFSDKNAADGKTVNITAITLNDTDKDNYKVASDSQKTATANISPRTIGINWSNTEFTYDKTEHIPTALATNVVDGDTCNITVNGKETNAGNYTATAAALDNTNYCLPTETAYTTQAFVIKKAVGELAVVRDAVNMKTGDYIILPFENEAFNVAEVSCHEGGTIVAESSNTAVIETVISEGALVITPNNKTGTTPVDVTITAEEAQNYNAASMTIKLYACDDINITCDYAPAKEDGPTNTDVVVEIHATDALSALYDSSGSHHGIEAVTVNDVPASKEGGTYYFTATENGTYYIKAIDTLGVEETKAIVVDWIDKQGPEMEINALGVVTEGDDAGCITTYIMATDNVSAYGALQYCWDYNGTEEDVWVTSSVKNFLPYETHILAVKDEAGNISMANYTARVSGRQSTDDIIIEDEQEDITGYIFGKTRYIDNLGETHAYETGSIAGSDITEFIPIEVHAKVTGFGYIYGYAKLSTSVKEFPIFWDENDTVRYSDADAVGHFYITPNDLTLSKKNAELTIYINEYNDESTTSKRLNSDSLTSTIGIDVTAPVVSIEMDTINSTISITAKDVLSGIPSNGVAYTFIDKDDVTSEYQPYNNAPIEIPVGTKYISVIATDRAGNVSTTKSTQLKKNAETGETTPIATTNKFGTAYTYRTYNFNYWLIGSGKDNISE